ncbi:MAG: DUF6062 family protein [Oscillospiraceae bacterium]
MNDTIYTIPINDVFMPKKGCPICTMRNLLEERCIEYILGAAMMEPDVRIRTNKYGFCKDHFDIMYSRKNKLALALMLESHLEEVSQKKIKKSAHSKKGESLHKTCFVCNEIDSALLKMISTIFSVYQSDIDFKTTFREQEYFCLPHYNLLCTKSFEYLNKKYQPMFIEDITKITQNYAQGLLNDVHEFKNMFDYRNANVSATPNAKSSIENTIAFLTSRNVK